MPQDADAEVANAVSLKLPTFWTKQPKVWFAQAEAQFALRNITVDDTKYHYVVAALDQEVASSVLNILAAPPANNKYDALKARLTSTYDLSEYERINQIIDMPSLGDEKPSVLMNKMLALMDDITPGPFLRCHFLRRLPEDIRCILVSSGTKDCRDLAKMADQLWEARQSGANAVSKASRRPRGGLCFYHERFGDRANRCVPPCSFKSGNGPAGRQ